MNKFLAVFFVILLFAGSAFAQNSEPSSYEITERTYTFYNGFIDDIPVTWAVTSVITDDSTGLKM